MRPIVGRIPVFL